MINEKPLSTEQRNALSNKEFGIPELRAYPLNDVSHVEQAVRMFNHVEPEYEKELADNLNKAIKKFGLKINVGDTNRFKKYVKESRVMNNRVKNVEEILEGLHKDEIVNKSMVNEGWNEEYYIDRIYLGREWVDVSKYSKGLKLEFDSDDMPAIVVDKKDITKFIKDLQRCMKDAKM